MIEKNQLIINSVTYPEDMNVISNVELANIIEKMLELPYDYIFINADASYAKNQYLFSDADAIVLLRDNNGERVDKIKTHLRSDNLIETEKICDINMSKVDRAYLIDFSKSLLGDRNG